MGAGAGTSLNEQLPEEEKHKPETRGQCVTVKENWRYRDLCPSAQKQSRPSLLMKQHGC